MKQVPSLILSTASIPGTSLLVDDVLLSIKYGRHSTVLTEIRSRESSPSMETWYSKQERRRVPFGDVQHAQRLPKKKHKKRKKKKGGTGSIIITITISPISSGPSPSSSLPNPGRWLCCVCTPGSCSRTSHLG
jgi:hypothetical protein